MKDIIVKFEPFILKQTVFIKDLETNEVKCEKIPQKDLFKLLSVQKDDIDTIHFFGNKNYIEKFKTDCYSKYDLKNVNIQINQ